jgi:hypothetical protein
MNRKNNINLSIFTLIIVNLVLMRDSINLIKSLNIACFCNKKMPLIIRQEWFKIIDIL